MPPDMAKYKAVSSQIREIFLEETPVIEPVSLDEAYLDLSEQRSARRTDLPAVGTRSHRATGSSTRSRSPYRSGLPRTSSSPSLPPNLKPRGFSVIGRVEAKSFLAPLPVYKIHGVGPATAERMQPGPRRGSPICRL
ncbi:MAG: hypothetical protein QM811_21260 [Pirellulales bacterium]